MIEKLKAIVGDDAFFYSVLIVLVGIVAFGLGRQSVGAGHEAAAPMIEITQRAVPAVAQVAREVDVIGPASDNIQSGASGTAVVASKNGTKYHLPTCPGAGQIKEANLVKFVSIEQARAAGYEPAKNCPGLQ